MNVKTFIFLLFQGGSLTYLKQKNSLLKFLKLTPAAVPKPDRTGATASQIEYFYISDTLIRNIITLNFEFSLKRYFLTSSPVHYKDRSFHKLHWTTTWRLLYWSSSVRINYLSIR